MKLRSVSISALVLAGAVVGVVTALTLGATASDTVRGDGPPQMLTADEVAAAQPQVVEGFSGEFPDGADLAPYLALPEFPDVQGTVSFEDGYLESQLVVAYQCLWLEEYIQSSERDHTASSDLAAQHLRGFYDLPETQQWYEDPDRRWEKSVLTPALAGDLKPARGFLATCL